MRACACVWARGTVRRTVRSPGSFFPSGSNPYDFRYIDRRYIRPTGKRVKPSDRTTRSGRATQPLGCPHSYQPFERCANGLNLIPIDRASEQRADVCQQHLIVWRRHSSAVEQLFRKSLALCAVLQAWRADTNRHTYQLFVFGGARLGSTLRAAGVQTDPDYSKSSHKTVC